MSTRSLRRAWTTKQFWALWLSSFLVTGLPIFIDKMAEWLGWFGAVAFGVLASLLFAFFLFWLVPLFRNRIKGRAISTNATYDRPRGIAVVTLGVGKDQRGGPSLTERLLAFANPSELIFITTSESQDTLADRRRELAELRPDVRIRELRVSASYIDASRIIEELRALDLGVDLGQLLFDITGGTKAMSVSAYLAAAELNADACYFSEDRYELFRASRSDDESAA